jgi:anti-sigma28 factor (negative regulator of flagellin synthesis)|tara:strand:- start:76 stop:429 length:354 start_codon:yes stop_codon:yes gene_type:complete
MIERKNKTIKQLQAECRKRKIGFMMNWTKTALTKRLEDEDTKDNELLELKNQLKEMQEAPKKAAEEAELQLAQCERTRIELEESIAQHHEEKVKLGKLWVYNNEKIEEIKSRIKSLI